MKFLRTLLLGLALALALPIVGTAPQHLGQQIATTAPGVAAPLAHYGAALDAFVTPAAHAAGVSDYTENKQVDHIFRSTAWTAPTTLCVALLTAAPSDSSTGATITEASYTNYARGQLNPGVANWKSTNGATSGASSGTSGATTNASTITFGTAAGSGPTVVTHFALLDSCTVGAGNVLFYGTLTASKTINNGDPAPTAPADSFSFTPGD